MFTNGPVMFPSMRSRVISYVCSNDFYWDGGNGLSGVKGVRTGEQLPPSKCIEKAMVSRITPRYFSTLGMTQIFEKTFHQFAPSTYAFPVFSDSLPVLHF